MGRQYLTPTRRWLSQSGRSGIYYEELIIEIKSMAEEEGVAVTGHCMKCKEKREMKDTEVVEMKNGRNAMKGTCSICGTKMFKILGNKA